MGLFNSGKNDKVEKVNKYERHYNVPPTSPRRRSSKHRSNQGEANARAMSQPPMMRLPGGFAPPSMGFYPANGLYASPLMGPMRYPFPALDMSKYSPATTYAAHPFATGQMNFSPAWNYSMSNQRSMFQQPPTDYQHAALSVFPPASAYGYMPPMQF